MRRVLIRANLNALHFLFAAAMVASWMTARDRRS
jgi:hypothetical protein